MRGGDTDSSGEVAGGAPGSDSEARAAATARTFDVLGLDYERAFADRPAHHAALERLITGLAPASRVLDLGCGTGYPSATHLAAAGHRVTGIDVSATMVALARARVPEARFEQADMRTYTAPAGSFEAVCSFFSLVSLSRTDAVTALARISRWLGPGGRLALSTVPADVDDVTIDFLGHPLRVSSFPTEVLLAHLERAGLVVDHHELATSRPDGAAEEIQLYIDAHRGRPDPV